VAYFRAFSQTSAPKWTEKWNENPHFEYSIPKAKIEKQLHLKQRRHLPTIQM